MNTQIQAEFLRNARGDTFIRFFDPAYVRADLIVLSRESKSLYAVLHEREHLIGTFEESDNDMFNKFLASKHVQLTSRMSSGRAINMLAPLSVSDR